MRVRLYETGSPYAGMVLIDRLPIGLGLAADGGLCPHEGAESLCSLEEVGGQVLLKARTEDQELSVNDAPLEQGLLQPGDRLRLGARSYIVSYEQTSQATTLPPRYRILG